MVINTDLPDNRYQSAEQNIRKRVLAEIKSEISSLLTVSTEIDSATPLIYEGEHVVEHIQRIDEFFDKLEDDLHEVRNYMLALQEFVLES